MFVTILYLLTDHAIKHVRKWRKELLQKISPMLWCFMNRFYALCTGVQGKAWHKIIANIYFNNKRKIITDSVHKDNVVQEQIQRFWKGVALHVGHHGWQTKKILGLRWSKKAKMTLEREKALMQQSMGKEKLRKVGLCFKTGCFIMSFNMINHFFVLQAHSQPNFCFWISGWHKKYKKGK